MIFSINNNVCNTRNKNIVRYQISKLFCGRFSYQELRLMSGLYVVYRYNLVIILLVILMLKSHLTQKTLVL